MQFVGSLSDWWLYQSGTSQLTDYLKSPRTILGDSDLTFSYLRQFAELKSHLCACEHHFQGSFLIPL
jgi:hypothetical protein